MFLVNEKCIIRFLYDRGTLDCHFINPADKFKLVATKAPETLNGYFVYPVYAVWKLLCPKDKADVEYDPWQALDKQLMFMKQLLTSRLTNVVNGDYSWEFRFSPSRHS